MRSGHCAKTNKRRANVQHPWAHVNPLVSVLAHFLTMRPPLLQSRHRRQQQMAGASFAPLHTSHVLSFYLVLSLSFSFVLLMTLSLAKLNLLTHMVPLASLTSAPLSFSPSHLFSFSFPFTYISFSTSAYFILLIFFINKFFFKFSIDAFLHFFVR